MPQEHKPQETQPLKSAAATQPQHPDQKVSQTVVTVEDYQSIPLYNEYHHHVKPTSKFRKYIFLGLGLLFCIPLFYLFYYLAAGFEPTFIRVPDLVRVKTLKPHHHPSHKHESRLILVGDVHGRLDALLELMKVVKYHHKRDHLVLLGDMVSKGPDSIGVLEYAMAMNASCVRGNHEDSILNAYAHLYHLPKPKINPPKASSMEEQLRSTHPLKVKDKDVARILKPKHIEYIGSCPAIMSLGKVGFHNTNAAAVHAGLQWNIDSLEDQDPEVVFTMRTLMPPEYTIPREERDGVPWSKVWTEKQSDKTRHPDRMTVFYGHDAHEGLTLRKYSAGLDSGCVAGGRLTAMVISQNATGALAHKIKSVPCA